MAASSPRGPRSAPVRPSRLSDYEKLEVTGSWETIDWNKNQPMGRSVSHGMSEFLLDGEKVAVEGHGVVLVNTAEAGTLLLTNYRLLFVSETTRDVIALGTIPLGTIEKFSKVAVKQPSGSRQSDKSSSYRLLQVFGKDMRIIVYGFRAHTKLRRDVFEELLRSSRPTRLWDLYVFSNGGSKCHGDNARVRLLNEYFRLLGLGSAFKASDDMIEERSFTFSNDRWRISDVNSKYSLSSTYPFSLIFPKSVSDNEILQASTFRAKCRLPVISWCHPGTGAVLARSSQPLVGLMMNARSNTDEKLVAAMCTELAGFGDGNRKMYIADARPRKNALANSAMGGGSEASSNYFQSEIVFFGIDNIHAMRESLGRLREYMDTYGTISSDGSSSILKHDSSGWTWGGSSLSSMPASVSNLGETGWLIHVQSVLAGSAWIAARIAKESASVLVHCSDGWDRTSQLVSLSSLLLDPYYRSLKGFQALVEKDWLAFGHPFSDRHGMPTVSGSGPSDLARHASTRSFSQSSLAVPPPPSLSHAQTSHSYSPILLQWVDCVSQLLRMYPRAFEFSSAFLVDFLDCVFSCRFGDFLCNSEKERVQMRIYDSCGSLWTYLTDLRNAGGPQHVHYNIFYDPLKHEGPILPPAAALAPVVWPQIHLRWFCPEEVEALCIETKCRGLIDRLSELEKAKELAERKTREASAVVESLTRELRKERQLRNSAVNIGNKATKENTLIKCALQSLDCRIQFSSNGDTTIDIGRSSVESSAQKMYSSSKSDPEGNFQHHGKSDLSVSMPTMAEDDTPNNPFSRLCESVCPGGISDGHCRWPEGRCAKFGSQLLGLKANFDAFDRLSIDDNYF